MIQLSRISLLGILFAPGLLPGNEVVELVDSDVTARLGENVKEKGSYTKLDSREVLKRGAVTLPDLLQREPGASVPLDLAGVDTLVPYLEGGSNSINIRGVEGNRLEILVDGIPQPDDFTARSFQGSGGPGRIYFDPAVFSSIELFKSAAPGSGALAGTLAGQTESPWTLLGQDLKGEILRSGTTYASSDRSWNERLATAWGNGDLASSLVYSYRKGHELENHNGPSANPSDSESHAFVWRAVFRKGEWKIEPTIDYFRARSFTDLDSIEVDSLIGRTLYSANDSDRERFRAGLDLEYLPVTGTPFADRYTAKFYFQSSSSANFNEQLLRTPTGSIRDRINDISYMTERGGLNLSAFKEVENHVLTYRYLGARSDVSGGLKRQDNGAPVTNYPNLAPSLVWDHSLSITDEIKLSEEWTVTPALSFSSYSVRPENTDDFLAQTSVPIFDEFGRLVGQRQVRAVDYNNTSLSPSLHLEYQPCEELFYFGSYTFGHRNPTAEELAGVFVHPNNVSISLPNPDLEAEESHSFELGLTRVREKTATTVSAYYNRYGNFLEGNVPTGEVIDGLEVLRTENARNAEIYGIELKSEWRENAYRIGGSFAWSEGKSDDGPLNSVEPWKAVVYAAYDDPGGKWGAELAGTYGAEKSESDILGDREPSDAYFLLDLTGYVKLSENALFRAGVKNLLDEEYVLWSRSNRGSGHGGGTTNSRFTQPGVNGFLSLELEF